MPTICTVPRWSSGCSDRMGNAAWFILKEVEFGGRSDRRRRIMKKLAVAGAGIVALLLSGGTAWAGHRCHCRPVRCHKVRHVHTCHTHEHHAADCGTRVELDCGHRVRQYCHRRTSHFCLRKLFGCRRTVSRCHQRHHCGQAVEYAPPSEGADVPAPPAEEVPAPPTEEVPAPPATQEAPAQPAPTPDAPPAPAPETLDAPPAPAEPAPAPEQEAAA